MAGLATLLFDLLTPAEERNALTSSTSSCWLAGWLTSPARWPANPRPVAARRLFGASTGAGAALVAATDPG